ncbi:cupin domain-containing protein [Mycobacteroides immunogenum]|uniref:Cupin n=1 Tax=Mycobacteroides immunogenum TaxID=83262 RepID=A0A7V8LMS5_9MYCO|nr:cupin domain-containing protein [Mycobacteroides immunogenum]AMT72587.1 cupin [Mycobacteroides immunogenum]ANO05749.1 cupin [Mycobacteroides immunogenum]KIU41092.1 cupin [Mycobacteroides immunogenum]KPG05999.1 cupin [Mycobacteroides immunogenum]KPG07650.1 cupin [Mycobacteroides immunogenum]
MTLEQFALGSAPLVRDGEREIVSTATGNKTGLVMDSNATGGAVSVLSIYLPQGADGAAPHFHTRSTELFYLVSGRLEVLVGDRIEVLEQGDTLLVPRLMPHAFGATGDSDANIFTVLSPGVQRFDYFRLLDRIVHGQADISELEATPEVYDNHFTKSPVWAEGRGLSALDAV